MNRRDTPADAHGTLPSTREPEDEASPDDIFAGFVRRANAEWIASVEAVLSEPDPIPLDPPTDVEGAWGTGARAPDDGAADGAERAAQGADAPPEPAEGGTDRIVLLTQKKSRPPPAAPPLRHDAEITVRRRADEILASPRVRRPRPLAAPAQRHEGADDARQPTGEWRSVVPARSVATQRREAARIVPDVASVPPPARHPQEGSEDGQMPSGELDRKLGDMDVLLRYGHDAQVEAELHGLRSTYPGDLLLLRRIAELYVARSLREPAKEALFALATGLFERRNVEGMRQALEQVLVLEPENHRALRLVALLDKRPSAPPPRR